MELLAKSTRSSHAETETRIRNRHGLHPRLACNFVRCARRFASKVTLYVAGQRFSACRVTDLLQANLKEGTVFKIAADGLDAPIAIASLETFLRHLVVVEDQNDPQSPRLGMRRQDQLCD